MKPLFIVVLAVAGTLMSCRSSRISFDPSKKFAPAVLQRDYTIFRKTLEDHHPGLYWYTPKEKMNEYFDWGYAQLNDSLTETSFRKILSYVTAKIQCGHTTVRWSKQWSKYIDTTKQLSLFPLSIKVVGNQAVITGNLHRQDSILTNGIELVAINGKTIAGLIDTLGNYISRDGGNQTARAQWLSNRGNFGSLHGMVFGNDAAYQVSYIDKRGQEQTKTIKTFIPVQDTSKKLATTKTTTRKPSRSTLRKENRNRVRQLQIDTVNKSALLRVASFGKGYRLNSFFRKSFKELGKQKINSLIIDVRNNGGGLISHSTLLTRYITDSSFKIADTLVATKINGTYDNNLRYMLWYKAAMFLFTKKKKDGLRHFSYYEKHHYVPRKKNHFDGKVYIITGGNSYSATTIFANQLKNQSRVKIVGEETGGAAYGNSAWMMPDLILPGTKLSVRVPLYKFVMDKNQPKDGSGVQPDFPAIPTIKSMRENKDVKMEAVLNLIKLKERKQEF
jgi:C-terminal processing protease CtpA/Prc